MDTCFAPGDQVIQRHQHGAQPVLVVATTDNPDVVVVVDPATRRYRRVLAWAYDLVSHATPESVTEAVDHTLTEAFDVLIKSPTG